MNVDMMFIINQTKDVFFEILENAQFSSLTQVIDMINQIVFNLEVYTRAKLLKYEFT